MVDINLITHSPNQRFTCILSSKLAFSKGQLDKTTTSISVFQEFYHATWHPLMEFQSLILANADICMHCDSFVK